MIVQNKPLVVIPASAMSLLLIPFIAMQFTNEVNWSFFDFMVMGSLLFATGLLGALVWQKVKSFKYRLALGLVILAAFLLIWVELAVGVFGTPFAGS